MQKTENVKIQLKEENQEQEKAFIGDYKLKEYYDWSRKSVRNQIVCLALFLLIIPLFVLILLELIWAIKSIIASLDDEDISRTATILGILSLFLVPSIISGLIINSKIRKKYPNIDIRY